MAYSSLSKLVPIDIKNLMSNIRSDNTMKPTLPEGMHSDYMKRLFNQPNLIIKTIPLIPLAKSDDIFWQKRNGKNSTNHTRSSEISILPVRTTDEEKEDANLLPSKIEHKKSEIALLPIEKKSCGHYEQCENIVCDVTLQQYADKDGVTPMLALSIEEDEINASVEKHCKNEYCDALSIDHNRCRRALIKLYRCDRSRVCDICGITFKRWITRLYHRNCTRKKEYVHNDVDRLHLLKERMRIRELQILEIAKMKRRDYSDPDRVMETLRKNEELIIIPQKASSQRPIVTMAPVSSTQLTNLINTQPIKINSQIPKTTNIFESVPLTGTQNTVLFPNNTSCSEKKVKSISQVRFSNLQQNSHLRSTSVTIPTRAPAPVQAQVASASPSVPTLTLALVPSSASTTIPTPTSVPTITLALTPTAAPTPAKVPISALAPISAPDLITTSASSIVASNNQCIRLAVSPQTTTVQSKKINNLIVSPPSPPSPSPSPSHTLPTSVQPKTFLTPIRVVPITNLISPPSLLHRTQGIPKFCIVAENVVKPVTIPNSPSVQPTTTAVAANTATVQVNASNFPTQSPIPKTHKSSKMKKAKKNFFCVYCSKNITTDWYFKMHIAKHKGEKLFFCNFCNESFSNNYHMKKHITNEHIGQQLACDKCNYTCTSLASFKSHIQTHGIRNLNKANVHSKKQRKLELLKDKISQKLIHKRKIKRIKRDDTSDSQNAQHNNKKKRNNKELSTINIDSNAKTKEFNFVSVKEIVEPENFEQESAITSR